MTVRLKDGKKFQGYYSGACYSGRSQGYAVDYELRSQELKDEGDNARINAMVESDEHCFVFELKDVADLTIHFD